REGLRFCATFIRGRTSPDVSVRQRNSRSVRRAERRMNVAIVGLGKIGIMHTAMVLNVPGAKLVALVDRVAKLGKHVQSMMSAPPPFFTSIEDAVRQAQVKAAFICTPQFAHRPVAEKCLELGLDVFVEKPLAHRLEDATAMLAAAKRHSRA